MLQSQVLQLVVPCSACLSLSLEPAQCFFLFHAQFLNDALELQNLVVNSIHLVLIFEQIVLVHVLDLELVVFSATSLDAVPVVEHVQHKVAVAIPPRANGLHVVLAEDVVALRQHVCLFKLPQVKSFSTRVVSHGHEFDHVSELLGALRIYQVDCQVRKFILGEHSFQIQVEEPLEEYSVFALPQHLWHLVKEEPNLLLRKLLQAGRNGGSLYLLIRRTYISLLATRYILFV